MFPARCSRSSDCIWRCLFASSFGATTSPSPGWLMSKEGTRNGKGRHSLPMAACSLTACFSPCPSSPDRLPLCCWQSQLGLLVTGYSTDHLWGCGSPPWCAAVYVIMLSRGHNMGHGAGESRAETPRHREPAVVTCGQPELVFPGCSVCPDPTLPCFPQHSPSPFEGRGWGGFKEPPLPSTASSLCPEEATCRLGCWPWPRVP